jgi:uncharacterized protein YabN with tetrapyrrole methylase and pyrophosphatase domain
MGSDEANLTGDALTYSYRVQSAASKEGFDWNHIDGVFEKVEEELDEIRSALAEDDRLHAQSELGDLLLIAVNLARFLGADPQKELLKATQRFQNRFNVTKEALAMDGKTIKTCAADELESYWQRVKPVADERLKKGVDMGPDDDANSKPVVGETLGFKGRNGPVDNL